MLNGTLNNFGFLSFFLIFCNCHCFNSAYEFLLFVLISTQFGPHYLILDTDAVYLKTETDRNRERQRAEGRCDAAVVSSE